MMTPDAANLEPRVRDLEQSLAVLRSQVSAVAEDVHTLTPLVIATTELRGSIHGLKNDLAATRLEVTRVKDALDERDKASTDERKAVRVALISLTGTIAAALIAGIVAVIVAGLG